ncbi:MAG: hypothetical protein KA974_03305 [Saprospiraceae bacterium]|nr:hypothetical protein [Saprospiraceae bacterium]
MENSNQFMVDFILPDVINDTFMDCIPRQRAVVNKLFLEGKLTTYALALENSRLWAIVNAQTQNEVIEILNKLPLTQLVRYRIFQLNFCNIVNAILPEFSSN